MRKQTLVSSLTTRFIFIELALGRMPILTKPFACKYLSNNICTVVEEWHHGYFCLGCFSSSTHFDLVMRLPQKAWRQCVLVFLCTIVDLVPETASVSLRTLVFFFPLVTGTFSSFNAGYSFSTLDHCSCFNSPRLALKFRNRSF